LLDFTKKGQKPKASLGLRLYNIVKAAIKILILNILSIILVNLVQQLNP